MAWDPYKLRLELAWEMARCGRTSASHLIDGMHPVPEARVRTVETRDPVIEALQLEAERERDRKRAEARRRAAGARPASEYHSRGRAPQQPREPRQYAPVGAFGHGVISPERAELRRACEEHGITLDMYDSRRRRGQTHEQALGPRRHHSRGSR
jgi:hypothetical protein